MLGSWQWRAMCSEMKPRYPSAFRSGEAESVSLSKQSILVARAWLKNDYMGEAVRCLLSTAATSIENLSHRLSSHGKLRVLS